jgi:hypothetical protein
MAEKQLNKHDKAIMDLVFGKLRLFGRVLGRLLF